MDTNEFWSIKFYKLVLIPKEIFDQTFQPTPKGDWSKQNIVHTKQQKKWNENFSSDVNKQIDFYNEPFRVHIDYKFLDVEESYEYLGIKVLTSVNGSMIKDAFL